MNREEQVVFLRNNLEPFIKERGFVLVDLKLHQRGRESFLILLVDAPRGGVSLLECTSLNREIQIFMEENSLLTGPYTLEVSSPGLDRDLLSTHDFLRTLNRRIRVFLGEPVGGKKELIGQLVYADNEKINLESDTKTTITVFMNNIIKAKNML